MHYIFENISFSIYHLIISKSILFSENQLTCEYRLMFKIMDTKQYLFYGKDSYFYNRNLSIILVACIFKLMKFHKRKNVS